jgi:diguanylate cyclase (GGDEF)-like protein
MNDALPYFETGDAAAHAERTEHTFYSGLDPENYDVVTDADMARCAEEPIHAPGAIQPHGCLLAMQPDTLVVVHASANLQALIGIAAEDALGRTLSDVLTQDVHDQVLRGLSATPAHLGVTVNLAQDARMGRPHTMAFHRAGNLVILEIEPHQGDRYPLNALESAQSVIFRLRGSDTLEALCEGVVQELRQVTGYDRVMVYRFDENGHGDVIAEAKVPELEPYLGLRYPASDIPAQARRMYLLTRIRIIGSARYTPVPILAHESAAAGQALDMSRCTLRSVSPIHLHYLRNMGAAASMSISIIQDQRLWGMLVCHHSTPKVPTPTVSVFCGLVGQLLGLLISEVEERQRLLRLVQCNELLASIANTMNANVSLADGIEAASADLLAITGSTGLLVRLEGHLYSFGNVPEPDIAHALLDAGLSNDGQSILHHANLGDLGWAHFADLPIVSGILGFRIADDAGDCMAWLRPEVTQTVRWGGNPNQKAFVQKTTRHLSPRASFAAWQQVFYGRSTPWSNADIKAAEDVRRLLTRALLRHTEMKLFRVANSDPLTGLPNRNVLVQRIDSWRSAACPTAAALMFIDLDRFKIVNDSLGHYAGDELLQQVAGRLSAAIGDRHLLARLGGDEFVIFSADITQNEAASLAERAVACFGEPFTVMGRPYRSSTSVGLVHTDEANADLLRSADAAMYAAKRQGGNCFAIFERGLQLSVEIKRKIEQDLFLALGREEISVAYQPIVCVQNGNLIGFEALARWQHHEIGAISPAEFIPIAEETGQISRLGIWIATEAISTLAKCRDKAVYLTINVSGRQLSTGRFCDDVEAVMARHDVAPNRIRFEVTESVLMDEQALRELGRLRKLGCRIAIDDFGTGYSSLAYLRSLPVDIIKIDRSFVAPIGEDTNARSFLVALVALIKTLGLDMIAEGVETADQRDILAQLGVLTAQGYHFGKPRAGLLA